MMKKSTWTKVANVILLKLGDLLYGGAFGALQGSVGLFFVVFAVIHLVQHWGWIGDSLPKSRS
jgi:hypothetical protein